MHRTFTASKTDMNKTIIQEPDQKQEKAGAAAVGGKLPKH